MRQYVRTDQVLPIKLLLMGSLIKAQVRKVPQLEVFRQSLLLYIIQLTVLWLLYFIIARTGLSLAATSGYTPIVWSPAGLALAALLAYGQRLWPAIFLASTLAGLNAGAPVSVAIGVGATSALETVLAIMLLRRLKFQPSLDRIKDVEKLFLIGAVLTPMISTVVGVSFLAAWKGLSLNLAISTFTTWWLADAASIMSIGAFLMVWSSDVLPKFRIEFLPEVLALLLGAVFINNNLFTYFEQFELSLFQQAYFIFPLLLWASVRFTQRGALGMVLLLLVLAFWGLANDQGPFKRETLLEGLIYMQLFMLVASLTSLFVASAITERQQKERRLKVQYQVMTTLAKSRSIEVAAVDLLEEIGKGFGWNVGLFWINDENTSKLKLLGNVAIDLNATVLIQCSLRGDFDPMRALPGRVIRARKPVWIEDLSQETDLHRLQEARREGLNAAFAFPVICEEKVQGVVEFFSPEIRPTDEELLECVVSQGAQIGQFIETKKKEHDLKEHKDALEVKVKERTEELQDAVRMQENLMAMVSHDLKNPLSVIMAGAMRLQRSIDKKDQRWTEMIVKAVKNMSALITNILDLHKMEAGYFKIDLASVTADHLLPPIVEEQGPLAEEKNIELTLEVREELGTVLLDLQQIERVFQNLISNAIKFTPEKGRITVAAERREDHLLFSVQDTGPGIAPEILPHMFVPFKQAEQTKKLGTGLGLVIAKGIVEAHGGAIWAESAPGKGTKFYFTIPA